MNGFWMFCSSSSQLKTRAPSASVDLRSEHLHLLQGGIFGAIWRRPGGKDDQGLQWLSSESIFYILKDAQ